MQYQLNIEYTLLMDLYVRWKSRLDAIDPAYEIAEEWGPTHDQEIEHRISRTQGKWLEGDATEEQQWKGKDIKGKGKENLDERLEDDMANDEDGYNEGGNREAEFVEEVEQVMEQGMLAEADDVDTGFGTLAVIRREVVYVQGDTVDTSLSPRKKRKYNSYK